MILTSTFCEIAKKYNLSINNVYEIGSLHGKDASIMCNLNNVNPQSVYIFEAHPAFAKQIQQSYPEFNVINTAVSNINGDINFNTVINSTGNLGMSSIRQPAESMKNKNEKHFHKAPEKYIETTAKCTRMDTWIEENNINNIDILKIDVEGCTYECLEGFGNKLDIVKIMHIEAEHVQCWEGQRLYSDVEKLLEEHKFKLLDIFIGGPEWEPTQQSDSVWINTRFLK